MNVDKIDDDIKVLLVIHPRDITDKAQYAIDQFILRGGKLIAFLDPLPTDRQPASRTKCWAACPTAALPWTSCSRPGAWPSTPTKVVADMNFKMQLGGRNGQPQEAPAVLSAHAEGINADDIVTSQIDNLWLPYAGAFTGTPVAGLKETVLLKSTKDSQLVEGFMANLAGENIIKDFKPSGIEYALAVRLTGKFKTAFPNGKPEDKKDDGQEEPTRRPSRDESRRFPQGKPSRTTTVVLVGDADMLYDTVALRQVPTPLGHGSHGR